MSNVPTPAPAPGLNTFIDKLLNSIPGLNGYVTYLSAAGFFITALYQAFIMKDYVSGWQSFLAGLAAAGLRHATAKSSV